MERKTVTQYISIKNRVRVFKPYLFIYDLNCIIGYKDHLRREKNLPLSSGSKTVSARAPEVVLMYSWSGLPPETRRNEPLTDERHTHAKSCNQFPEVCESLKAYKELRLPFYHFFK